MKITKELGRKGEEIAKDYLTRNNYCIIECNYLKRCGEIDVIVKKDNTVVFVEVKARFVNNVHKDLLELPEVTVSRTKIKKIRTTALEFIKEKKLSPDGRYRFDVISIVVEKGMEKIKHMKYAF